MTTRLKRLDLHGFKSFATPTPFVFDTGFTAIIGPNGSGKSNISDALRWVLGEQSYTNLRGRRTEDIIFAGSSARAPLGMAEVTVTLDNQDGSLPIAFSEVSVTRRAYRSGESQYLINGVRVRLKDILDVTASLGQSHTVIGQGLVDAVLSQRAGERRGLFEHAAGITGLRLKHATAARNLEESQANCARLEDLLADLEPRLRSLERAARQAREYDDVKRQLRTALKRTYARYWRQASARLVEAQGAVERLAAELATAERARDERRRALERARQAVAERSSGIDQLRDEIARLLDEEQRLTHNLALLQERQTASRDRRDDVERSLGTMQSSLEDLDGELATISSTLASLGEQRVAQERRIRDLEAARAESHQVLAELEARLREADERRSRFEREAILKEGRLTLLRGQIDQLDAERARILEGSGARSTRCAELERELVTVAEAETTASRQIEEISAELTSLTGGLDDRIQERDRLKAHLAEIDRRLVEAGTRFEALKRLEESGVGLYAGVRQVLEAARKKRLDGVLGTLSSLLVVPAELEAAIEAALGGHLQDLVVERWPDAEAAIAHLKRTQGGRATFHPLDTIRSRDRSTPPRVTTGIRGMAAELIGMDERVRPVVDAILGRVLVAEDLDAARESLRALPNGWSVVTLGGEIVRSGGTVTGGSRIKESGALARERELRDLPRLQVTLRKRRDDANEELATVESELSRVGRRKAELERAMADARADLRDLAGSRAALKRQRLELERAAASDQERVERIAAQLETVAREIDDVSRERVTEQERLEADQAEVARLRESLARVRQAVDDEPLHAAKSELSALRERIHGVEEQRRRIGVRVNELQAQRASARSRLTDLDTLMRELEEARVSAIRNRDSLTERLEELERRHEAARAGQQASLQAEQIALSELEAAEERIRELERRHDQLTLEAARRRDELDLTVERAGRDLEEDDVESVLAQAEAALPADLPRLEREITRLRERLRRIGVAGDDAIEQYEREAERASFLRRQLDDVRAATDALRALMSELDRTMASEFDRTFGEVARAFETTFANLFGGGRARLIRSDDEDGSAGIDIVAQPPGKRLQNLSLLSGGERALTAVALLFSILKVNPSPFCLLDEVDAALDEANVVRVRDELRRLAERTQFVVVTHNRATIEGADTLYGITMGDDGVSRVLSLRMPSEAAGERV